MKDCPAFCRKSVSSFLHILVKLLFDIVLTGLILSIFAVFHHVIPFWGGRGAEESVPIAVLAPQEIPIVSYDTAEAPKQDENLRTPWQIRFADKFSETVQRGEWSYTSPQISFSVTRVQIGEPNPKQTYFVADIYISQIENLRTAAANGSFTRYSPADAVMLAELNDALLQVNGDYCSSQRSGFLVRNGELYYDDQTANDICVLYYDGRIVTYGPGEYDVEDIITSNPYQVWKFGPRLLDGEGNPLDNFNTTASIAIDNPRTALGYYEPGHYCFVVSDGRQPGYSSGLAIRELAQVFSELGCVQAYNLDGGASSSMTVYGEIINKQCDGGRPVGDTVYLAELPENSVSEN